MANIVIKDLDINKELDKKAMSSLRGGQLIIRRTAWDQGGYSGGSISYFDTATKRSWGGSYWTGGGHTGGTVWNRQGGQFSRSTWKV